MDILCPSRLAAMPTSSWPALHFHTQLPSGPHGHPVYVTASRRGLPPHGSIRSLPDMSSSTQENPIFPQRVLPSTDLALPRRSDTTCWWFPFSGWTASSLTTRIIVTALHGLGIQQPCPHIHASRWWLGILLWHAVAPSFSKDFVTCFSPAPRLIRVSHFGHPRTEGHLDSGRKGMNVKNNPWTLSLTDCGPGYYQHLILIQQRLLFRHFFCQHSLVGSL